MVIINEVYNKIFLKRANIFYSFNLLEEYFEKLIIKCERVDYDWNINDVSVSI
jgi:hypothetical protein